MKKIFTLIVILSLIVPMIASVSISEEEVGITMRVDRDVVTADGISTANLLITNPLPTEKQVDLQISGVDAGWSVALDEASVIIPAYTTTTVPVTISAPGEGEELSFTVTYVDRDGLSDSEVIVMTAGFAKGTWYCGYKVVHYVTGLGSATPNETFSEATTPTAEEVFDSFWDITKDPVELQALPTATSSWQIITFEHNITGTEITPEDRDLIRDDPNTHLIRPGDS